MKRVTEDKLASAQVHIGGLGRLGTTIAMALQSAGIGGISGNDPQTFDEEQMGWCVFARRADLGRPKVHLLERFFDGRPNFRFEGIQEQNQSPKILSHLKQADLIFCCANDLAARLSLERAAIELGKPCIQATIQDGRQSLGGFVSVWAPESDLSCFGCIFPDETGAKHQNELLIPTVARLIGDFAAHLGVQILRGDWQPTPKHPNVFVIDLKEHSIESLSVRRRTSCRTCRPQLERS